MTRSIRLIYCRSHCYIPQLSNKTQPVIADVLPESVWVFSSILPQSNHIYDIYVEQSGASVKGTELFVAADNLAAHALGGFLGFLKASLLVRYVNAVLQNDRKYNTKKCKQDHSNPEQWDPFLALQYGV